MLGSYTDQIAWEIWLDTTFFRVCSWEDWLVLPQSSLSHYLLIVIVWLIYFFCCCYVLASYIFSNNNKIVWSVGVLFTYFFPWQYLLLRIAHGHVLKMVQLSNMHYHIWTVGYTVQDRLYTSCHRVSGVRLKQECRRSCEWGRIADSFASNFNLIKNKCSITRVKDWYTPNLFVKGTEKELGKLIFCIKLLYI